MNDPDEDAIDLAHDPTALPEEGDDLAHVPTRMAQRRIASASGSFGSLHERQAEFRWIALTDTRQRVFRRPRRRIGEQCGVQRIEPILQPAQGFLRQYEAEVLS